MNNCRCAQCHVVRSIRYPWVCFRGLQFCSGSCYRAYFNIPSTLSPELSRS